jgi:Fe-S-cluster containining protein
MEEQELADAVRDAAAREDVLEAVDGVYRLLDQAVAIRKPICTASGRCCRFEEFGHRLYLTTMELAKFVADLSAVAAPRGSGQPSESYAGRSLPIYTDQSKNAATWDGRGCPFQVGGLCGVHEIRPFGCRIFFCDPTSVDWQHDQYERHHARLRNLHDALAVPYYYVEWRFALKSLGLAESR